MASDSLVPEQVKPQPIKGKRQLYQAESLSSDCEGDGSFVFEADEAWKDFHSSLLQFYEAGELCDVTLKVGSKLISCHKLVLACVIPYFRAMFLSEMAESTQTLIEIKDFDGDAIADLVKFAYSSRLTLTVDNVQPLLYAACILQVELVAKACCEYMKLHFHPSNCLAVRAFAESHNRIDLMDMADWYACEHFPEVVECEDFVNMSPHHLHKLLSSGDLNIQNEKQVYGAAIKWLHANPQHHALWLDELLAQVRLPLLPIDFLMGIVAKEEIVKQNLKCRDLLDEARNYHLQQSCHTVPDFEYSIRTTPRKQTAGVLFCVGGRGGSGDPFRSIECYSINKNSWFFGPEMNSRRRHVGVISVGGAVYAVGGHDGNEHLGSMEVFDPLYNKWIIKASMNKKRRGIALASLGGPIYAIGGLDDHTCFNDVERYDIESDRWSIVAPMNTPRGGVGSVALMNHVYAVGGNDGVASLSSVERYDPHLDKWIEIKEMGQRRAGNGVSELHGCLYVVGGFDDNSPLSSVERFDPRANKWEYVAELTTPRGGVGIATLMGKIFAVGGHNGNAYLNTVESYDSLMNRWELVGSVSHCRAGAGVAVCSCLSSQIRDVGHGSSNVVDCM
ncbi:kelch-like protein 8 isoform X1 [Rhinatrema bivittatum]|uniref:kelch-like protein 8 isoform X1 n=2 Tax=Rhinatrema bivittatum TaxID=194408 RepID=UPI001127BAA8|nr:kelch-like protein 8 isoform X1 [Rhinatrema bivittatum]XP_029455489.1 kelch-like protein 8 isoform X1 [Rhinatrema bivittatum]XP_029455498.1 kelch-like protein 8 isoform X1 [Rhinatrema bivittatum]XP_029455504.1 kelch-like protein 8 isoform X1 [Rhinatrema bivittatum]XP_029455512.1 kelch-like protein 8 isoform X1 [Rhinatrema bivittatum]XP_029455520.1 kelch-like protein 8 isoform X1 [Rhinatrema bivittatum]